MKLDVTRSRITVQTYATGMLSALAHDLCIAATPSAGEAQAQPPEATVRIPVASLRVVGVLRGGAVVEGVLSPSDRTKIEERIRDEVFPGVREIVVTATLDGESASFNVDAGPRRAGFRGRARRHEGTVRGEVTLSLAAMGIREVKGPLGAIKVKDGVTVRFEAAFA